ncbi:protein HIRA homolog [Drosophila sulfurigaster albostrigata]|uniref:protein HIRA homolog n=1 Tax=Drosophila sulfurigaster albostrigata TaxID=89887 RepID=UPI002D21B12C|nr:protein HIRA homolog [Drosophila sulfurigaster albostrigata]
MRLVKPGWVHHDDKPIFSVDVHQDCTKFATGGQGNDSGRIVIWNLKPVLCEKDEHDASVPKMLCQMDQHLACVNCVRWSQNGELLASGSDDKLIMIWRKAQGSSGVFGTGGMQQNHESWKCQHTLRGHDGDVLDLAWSPNDIYLASCSIDNTIIVWDGRDLPTQLQTLKGHTGLVKGVAWDPVGKFLASQSDDRSIKVWRTNDWMCGTTISEPFLECGGTTHILRLSWSPDGQYLVSAHAMNGGGPTAQIIEREGWKCDQDFVGHRKAVTCVRFHNSILKRHMTGGSPSKPTQYCVLAVGSRDRSLSVWLTALQRPMVVIHELFNDSVLDISWGPQQCLLMACSGDGTIACLQFNEQELGTRLSGVEEHAIFKRKYGGCIDDFYVPPKKVARALPELSNLTLPNAAMDRRLPVQAGTGVVNSPARAISKQTETRTKDGKRRITPVFIPLNDMDQTTITSVMHTPASSLNNGVAPVAPVVAPAVVTPRRNSMQQVLGDTISNNSNTIVPKPQISANSKCEFTKSSQDYRIYVQNGHLKTGYGMVAKVTAQLSREQLWELYVGSPVINVNLCSKYVMLGSLDGSMRLLAMSTGCPVFPAISLTGSVIHCTFSPDNQMVGVLTDCGLLRIWDISKRCIRLATNCLELLSKHGTTLQFAITDQGMPLMGFPSGNSYSYSTTLKSWLVLATGDAIMFNGIRGSLPRDLEHMNRKFPLLNMQANTQNIVSLRGAVEIDPESWQQTAKVSFLENQIKLCEALEAVEELKHWHTMLTFQLATYGTEKRLRIFLDSFINSDECCNSYQSVPKHELMHCVLESLKPHIQWEHIYNEYLELYKLNESNFVMPSDDELPQSSNLCYPLPTTRTRTRAQAAAAAAVEAMLTAEPSSPPPTSSNHDELNNDQESEETESDSSSLAAPSTTPEQEQEAEEEPEADQDSEAVQESQREAEQEVDQQPHQLATEAQQQPKCLEMDALESNNNNTN